MRSGYAEYVFLSLQEISPNGAVLQQITLQNGSLLFYNRVFLFIPCVIVTWSLVSRSDYNDTGGEMNYNYTSLLSNDVVLEYHFLAISEQTIITLGELYPTKTTVDYDTTSKWVLRFSLSVTANNFTFGIDPQYLKFSMRMSFWNWTAA